MAVTRTRRLQSLAGGLVFAAGIAPTTCERGLPPDWTTVNDFRATACLRAYAGAQNIYRRIDYDGDGISEYACPYTRLYWDVSRETGERARLIGWAFACASKGDPASGITTPKAGYIFVDLTGDAKEGPYDDGNGNFVRGYGLCAYPAEYGRTGRYTYVIDLRFEIYRKDTEGRPVTLFPDLVKDGWEPSTW